MTAGSELSYESIRVTREGSIAVVTLNRPDMLNAWDWQMAADLSNAYDRLDRDDEVRAIVLTGAGRAFCAGAALLSGAKNFNNGGRQNMAEKFPNGFRTAEKLRTPVIAAINGAAVGAGITMAMGADIRVAAEDATIGFVFHRRGVIPDGDLLWSLPRQIGYGTAMDLLLTGRKISGAEAYRIGLVSRLAAPGKTLELALSVANEIANNVAPLPAALSKTMARRLLQEPDQDTARAMQTRVFAWSVAQADAAEGVNSFLERRPPRWRLSANSDFPTDLFDDGRN